MSCHLPAPVPSAPFRSGWEPVSSCRAVYLRASPAGMVSRTSLSRRLAPIVDPGNRHLGDRIAGIDEAQPTRLRGVPSRIEIGNAMPRLSPCDEVEHAGQHAVPGADVRKHLDVQSAFEPEAPVALHRRAGGAGQSLLGIALFEVIRVEVDGLVGRDGQRQRWGLPPGVVDGVDSHLAIGHGTVDDPHEALAVGIRCRQHQ